MLGDNVLGRESWRGSFQLVQGELTEPRQRVLLIFVPILCSSPKTKSKFSRESDGNTKSWNEQKEQEQEKLTYVWRVVKIGFDVGRPEAKR